MHTRVIAAAGLVASFVVVPSLSAQGKHQNAVIDLWMQGKPAFGIFVPNENARRSGGGTPGAAGQPAPGAQTPGGAGRGAGERPKPLYTKAGGEKLAANPLYDYLFLNLEGGYDSEAVKNIADGLRSAAATSRKSLIVRIPAFHEDPAAARQHVREIFAAGGDGVTFPHVQSVDEAKQILAVFAQEKVNVWSAANPKGEKLAMLMLEDPDAVAQATEIANLKGYSILACGIGSLTGALKGDRAGAEAGTQKILAETKRVKLVNMLTATTGDVEKRVKEGFLAILAQGQDPDDAIKQGRMLAGR
jgi:2-keto-3-deoxy-L-rhamnonate aldolase RhmA